MSEMPPFHEYLGVTLERRGDGEVDAVLALAPHHRNRRGVVHGGVVAALLDTALGAAVASAIPKEWWCATISLSVQFLQGTQGLHLRATGRVRRRGVQVAFASGEVKDDAGRLIATAEGSWHLWPHRPTPSGAPRAPHYVVMRGSGERIEVGKIVAVGRNYAEHIAEMGHEPNAGPPVLFVKPSTALVHDGGEVRIPPGMGSVHHEVEMVVVIGKPGRAIPAEAALEHVAGYAVGLDMTLRDVQAEAKKAGNPWAVAKGFDTSAPVSLVAPREEVGDGSGLRLTLTVNGELRQADLTSRMIHGVPALVALASKLFTLERGDLVFTGTPSGVGPVSPGDRLIAELERVGRLEIGVVPDDPAVD